MSLAPSGRMVSLMLFINLPVKGKDIINPEIKTKARRANFFFTITSARLIFSKVTVNPMF